MLLCRTLWRTHFHHLVTVLRAVRIVTLTKRNPLPTFDLVVYFEIWNSWPPLGLKSVEKHPFQLWAHDLTEFARAGSAAFAWHVTATAINYILA